MMICSLFRNTMVSQHDGGKRETNPTCSINSNNKHNKTWCDDIFSLVQSCSVSFWPVCTVTAPLQTLRAPKDSGGVSSLLLLLAVAVAVRAVLCYVLLCCCRDRDVKTEGNKEWKHWTDERTDAWKTEWLNEWMPWYEREAEMRWERQKILQKDKNEKEREEEKQTKLTIQEERERNKRQGRNQSISKARPHQTESKTRDWKSSE